MQGRRRRTAVTLACALALSAALAAPAAAREVRTTVATPAAPGPAELNRVWVDKFGPKKAKRVLVLMPGTSGGSADFTLTARYLVNRIKGLQVWSIDRRTAAFEDTAMFERALRGEASLQEMFDYYLGWLAGATPPDHYELFDTSTVPFARQWGMKVALNDARAVVRKARGKGKRKRQVILGGHSLGASLTAAYAAWDFNGRPGYKDIDGMVLIDGGLLGSFDPYDLPQAQAAIAYLESSNPFLFLIGLGIPEAAGLFADVGAIYAQRAPTAPATTLQSFPLLPPQFNVTPVSRLAATFGREPGNGVEWFFPRRLTIDTNGADQLAQNDVANYLGLRLFHLRKVNDPLYVIQTDLTDGGVLAGGRAFIERARTTKRQSTLVNADPEQAHLDPLMAAEDRNAFYSTLVPFLRKKVFPLAKQGKKPRKRKGRA